MNATSLSVAFATLAMLSASSVTAQSTSGDTAASVLLPDVVRITAHFQSGPAKDGFGIIVGQDARGIYIVTADHVVRREDSAEADRNPTVIFYQDQGKRYQADLLDVHLPRGTGLGDVAALRILPPPDFKWNRNAATIFPDPRGTDVWFIGKVGEWYVPSKPGKSMNSESPGSYGLTDCLSQAAPLARRWYRRTASSE